jgi:uncharacterized protein YbbC (DUF1343 family)
LGAVAPAQAALYAATCSVFQRKSAHASRLSMLTKRAVLAAVPFALTLAMPRPSRTQTAIPNAAVASGADMLAASGFANLAGKRVGLITNQTGLVGDVHLADLLRAAAGVKLTAILAPEHGFRGGVEAGKRVGDGVDPATGVHVFSLYGASKKPTPAMLRNVDVLVFDIQDIGVRFYTYISTMGLAMQAAAEARIPFVVLDRPNPLGGDYVSGFALEPKLASFVGQYQIPTVHGLTVGELARMIKGEKMLPGLDTLDLRIIEMKGWERSMRWPQTQRAWVATSPNIPTFESALVYPGIGVAGEIDLNEGRGTPTPFSLIGAPWLDGARLAGKLNALALPGVRFEPDTYTPHSIPGVAASPRFAGKSLHGMRVVVTDVAAIEPLEMGMHVLSALVAEAHAKRVERLFPNLAMFHAIAGTKRLHGMLTGGSDGATIIAAWQADVAKFKDHRARYLLY